MNDFSHICPNCCRESADGGGYCAVCGTDTASVKNEEFCIPAGSVLLDRYFIGKVIGQGGFGITYLGFDDKFKTKIAVKEFFPHGYAFREIHKDKHTVYSLTGEKTEFYNRGLEKFIAEARRLAQFSGSPGIVNVRDYFNENNTAYIVMEFVEGEPLEKLLERKGTLTEAETIEIFLPILKTLQRVHAAGILHRDIAPDNIMVEPEGTARLIDFGASAEVDESAATSAAIIKHFYAPEEQYDSNRRRQGSWTDVYAISATIFRCIEGKTLPDALERLRGVAFDGFTVPVSKPVAKAVIHGLALFAKDRAQTVDELIAAFSGTSDTAVYYRKKKPAPTATEKSENTKKPKLIFGILSGVAAIAAAVCLVIFPPRTAETLPAAGEIIETTAAETTIETTAATVTTAAETAQTTAAQTTTVQTTTIQTTTAATTTTAQTTTTQTTEAVETYVENQPMNIYGLGNGTYTGSFKNNMPYEKGVFTFSAGSYDGEWQGGRPNGEGTLIYTGIATYTGGISGGKYDGQGTLELADGAKYVGEFKNGQKNGKGKEYTNEQSDLKPGTYRVTEGTFVNGSITGDYIVTYENADGWFRTEYHNQKEEQTGTYTQHAVQTHPEYGTEEYDNVFINNQYQGRINLVSTPIE
jgi:serine/threonine protein kinase